MKTTLCIVTVMLLAVVPLHAQFVADGATNTLSNVTTNLTGPVIVGTNGSFTLLVLSDNALLTNSANGIIGRFATAKSNEVRLISSTARWQMGGSLFVGTNGSSSRLVVSNGALLENLDGNLGFTSASSNNSALITGPGSLWTNRGSVTISGGFLTSSSSNQIVVSDGAALVSGGAASVGGFGSQVLITGAGSRWASQSEFTLGGTGIRMEVSEGAGLVSGSATIGTLFSGDANTALLTGDGSTWTNNGNLTMGYSSSRALLTASNGATLFIGGTANIGALSGSLSNRVSVTDPGTICMVGSNLFVGGNSSANLLAISNGGLVVSSNGFLGATLGGSVNSALVTGAGSVWSNRNLLYIGAADRDNQLVVSNGAWVISSNGILGQTVSASSNTVVVTGAGSRWTTAVAVGIGVNVGASGSGNRLVISDGGRVTGGIGQMGQTLGGSNNFALVTGSGSVWSNAFDLDIYQANLLIVSNGGAVFNSAGRLGVGGGNNQAIVTGTNSLWRSSSFLGIGVNVSGNRLTVSNDGLVSADNIYVGLASISLNNRVVVDGGTLRATNVSGTATLDVRRGTNVFNAGLIEVDQLILTNAPGKFEFNGGTLITRSASINNGLPFVVGQGGVTPAIWDVRAGPGGYLLANRLIVGSNASFNQVFITNGAVLNCSDYTFLAFNSGNNNNLVVSGPGSTFNSPFGFFIGADGNANQMRISSGGQALANTGSAGTFIGRSTGTRSNLVVVADGDSRWSVNDTIYVGAGGNANQLVISNGARVEGLAGYVGSATAGSNNLAIVTGVNSSWSNRFDLYVGAGGGGNQLRLNDGGTLINSNAYLGLNSSSRSNTVAVTGSGSLWNNRTDLTVGYDGADNQLVVSNAATVSVGGRLLVGLNPTTASGNRIVVDGGSLYVTNGTGNGLLEIRRGTNVLNAGLIETDILRMTNGTLSKFVFTGGTLSVKSSRVSIGPPLIIGNGISPATFNLAGNGTHDMSGTLGLIISSNATLTGNGSLIVQLQVLAGAQLAPGASVGKISLSTPPFFSGTITMELAKNGATVTNDQIQVTGAVTYGGALTVTHLGPTALAVGDKFQLFNASAYAGSFTSLTLPPLPPPLSWTNKLLVDGSIEVIAPPAIAMSSGTYTQSFDSLSLSGGSNPWRDNSTLLGWYAAKSVVPASITNYIASDGSGNAGALYSFGSAGLPERALGSIGSGSVGTISYGLGFLNDTRVTVSNFNLTFTGEQWRSSSSLNANTLTFWYRVSPSPVTNPEPGITTDWTQVTSLNFVSPVLLGTGVPLDGNVSSNRQLFASVLINGLLVTPGQNVFFRWQDPDDTGTDQGLAVDDLIVSFSQLPAERFWTNSLGGSYEVASNWLAHALVRPEDSANFTNNADYQVNWSAGALAANAFFNAQTGTVTQAIGPRSWTLTNNYVVGRDSVATAAVTHVSGSLFVTNTAGDAQFVVGKAGQGTFLLAGGTVETDWLFATNGLKSMFIFDGGTFRTRHAAVTNGQTFIIGDGLAPATFELLDNGTLSVANSINVRSNATLRGDGTLLNHLFVSGTLSPGNPIGQLAIPGFLTFDFDSRAVFELNKAAATHDKVVGISNLFYRGTLIVTNVAGTLANGDNFKLFDFAARQASAFTNMILPALDPGLKWRNKLMMDGSLEVLTIPTRDFGVDVSHFQGESGISQASWNQMFADGKRFAFIKATEGLTGPHDAAMATNVVRAAAAGLLVGVYHFAHPENRPTTNGAILEASNMVVYAGSAIGPGRLRPVIDIEGAATTLSTTALTDWVIAFADEIIARRGPGAAPIVYCSQNSANFEFDSRLANYDLWLRTIGGSNPATDDPINTLGFDPTGVFNEWSFWQYSDTGNSGGISPLDLDVCHSEYKPLSTYLIPGSPAPSPIQLGSPVLTGNGLQFSFTNTAGAVFTVLATTNVSLPLSNWTVLGPAVENPPGQFQFADLQATNHPQRLYRVTSP